MAIPDIYLFQYSAISNLVLYTMSCTYMYTCANLFDSHHSLHVFGGVPDRQTGEAAVPVHQVVVEVTSNQPHHIAQVGFIGRQYIGWDSGCLQGLCVHLYGMAMDETTLSLSTWSLACMHKNVYTGLYRYGTRVLQYTS